MRLKFSLLLIATFGLFTLLSAQDETAASLYNDGLAKLKAKEYSDALSLLEKAIDMADPAEDQKVLKLAQRNAAFASYYVGNALRKEKKYDEAQEVYQKGIGYSTSVYSNYVGIAQVLEAKGEVVASVKAYLKAADMTRKAGRDERADKLVSKASNFAAVAWGKKDWDEAAAAAQAFIDVKENAESYYYMGLALKEKGKLSEALESVDKAIELAEEDVDRIYYAKGEIHEALGQKSAAIEAYKMVKDAKYVERAKYQIEQLGGK